jgi:hypothetical protein
MRKRCRICRSTDDVKGRRCRQHRIDQWDPYDDWSDIDPGFPHDPEGW